MTPHPAFSMTTLYVRFSSEEFTPKMFQLHSNSLRTEYPCSDRKGFPRVSLFRGTQVNRTDFSQVKSQPLHDTDPLERQRAQHFKRTPNVYSSIPVVLELCIHVLSKHVINRDLSQIMNLEVTSHLQVHCRAYGSGRVTWQYLPY